MTAASTGNPPAWRPVKSFPNIMHETVSGLVASYGYVVLFFLVGLENLGIPLPDETALVTAAAFAALGHLSISAVIATAVAAAIVGDNGGYWIGRQGGIALVRRPQGRGRSADDVSSRASGLRRSRHDVLGTD